MPVKLLLIAAGLILLVGLKLLRRRHPGWVRRRSDFRTVGYLLPLVGLGLTLSGIGMLWLPGEIGADWLNNSLLVVLLAGLLCFVLAFLAAVGVPMPSVLLPRWYRESTVEPPEPDEGVTP